MNTDQFTQTLVTTASRFEDADAIYAIAKGIDEIGRLVVTDIIAKMEQSLSDHQIHSGELSQNGSPTIAYATFPCDGQRALKSIKDKFKTYDAFLKTSHEGSVHSLMMRYSTGDEIAPYINMIICSSDGEHIDLILGVLLDKGKKLVTASSFMN